MLLSGCAIMGGGPTGGKKDVTAPKITQESPVNKTVNFTGRKISINFDEYIQLDNPFSEVIISPTVSKIPDITVSGKSLLINFKDIKLDSNTTYSIQFGKSIKDYHEGNVLKGYRYVFSTGPYLDSLSISGTVVSALIHKPAAGIKVELYRSGYDSAIFKKRPLYYARTDSFGHSKIDYLHKGRYILYALNDRNDNYLLEQGEDVGFPITDISLDTSLEIKDTVRVFPYLSERIVIRKVQLANRMLQVKFE
jgi:hypothetical protein